MRCYRCQPQAKSDVYRNVLLRPVRTDGLNNSSAEETNERGDLIKFYNDIYVTVMTAVITKFTSNSNQVSTNIHYCVERFHFLHILWCSSKNSQQFFLLKQSVISM